MYESDAGGSGEKLTGDGNLGKVEPAQRKKEQTLMARDEHIQELMAKLIRAIESSLAASDAVRDAMKELVQQGYDTRLIFVANAESGSAESPSQPPAVFEQASLQEQGTLQDDELLPDAELQFEMTATDRDFLRSLAIDPDDT